MSRVPKSLLWMICQPTGIYTTVKKGQSPSIVLEMCISTYCLSNQQIFIELKNPETFSLSRDI